MSTNWLTSLSGKFIVFDGPDGSGKSTQFKRFADLAKSNNLNVCDIREPGGTSIGEQIRNILLNPENHLMDIRTELLLYTASRAQLTREVLIPAMERGDLILADRFISSTLAYQGTAGGFPVEQITSISKLALGDVWPDFTIIFDVDEQTASTRLNPTLDRMEQKGAAYHKKVRQGYLDQVTNDPDHYILIDATPDTDTVFNNMCNAIQKRI